MKQLEFNLNKRLLIVEFDDMQHLENVVSCDKQGIRFCSDNDEPTKIICKGSDITEDIAKGFLHQSIHTGLFAHYVKGIPVNTYCYKTALESFISCIEASGYHWGEKPLENCQWKELEELNAKSKTFNPSKCIIFEIL